MLCSLHKAFIKSCVYCRILHLFYEPYIYKGLKAKAVKSRYMQDLTHYPIFKRLFLPLNQCALYANEQHALLPVCIKKIKKYL